ncbi:putative disease resistance protein RGA3 [Bienertia sinuspersici]
MESMKLVRLSTSSSMSNLNVLRIRLFKELKSLRFGCPNSIQTLMISHCKRLRNIEGLQHCCILEKLENKDCKELELEEEAEEGNTNDNSTTCREGIISDLVIKALEVLGKAAFKEAASWWGARDELTKLGNTMRLIQARVRDAEKRQEDDSSESIREWLRRLRLVLYRADDLFDEVITLDRQKQRKKSTVAKVGILFSKFGPLYYNKRLANEIMSIRKELDAIKSDMAGLDLRDLSAEERPMARLLGKRETASFVNTEDVIGRDNDKDNIIKMLFDTRYDNQTVTVIPIVGLGGLGKTTLAQLVFNNEMVMEYFDVTKWAYVPEKENMIAIMGKIFKSFTGKDHQNRPLEKIKQGIRDTIEGKKYLLVLDDLWDEGGDRLIDLMNLLKCGKQGSKVIVTTRYEAVAKNVGTIGAPYQLGLLTDDQSWVLFKMLAFKQEEEENNSAFSEIRKDIISMCGNVPLAIKVVAGFLRSRDTKKVWQAQDAQHSKAQLTEGIMDVLKLSYDYLPPALKQCFAYCSLYPKGWCFDKDDVVSLWMAQGYFESSKDTGDQLFLELLARGFFQDPELSDEGNVKYCRMHDLMHDLAQQIAGEESIQMGDNSSIQITERVLHVNLFDSEALSSLFVARRMRSLFLIVYGNNLERLISRFQYLRTFCFDCHDIKKIPNSIGRLIHLRYLSIKSNAIERLPNSITRLENLQTLNLERCWQLRELPSDFAKLANLRHLLLPQILYPWTDLPPDFDKLTSLQALNGFIVGERYGIHSLPALNYRGYLNIKIFKWRRDATWEAQRANLKDKDLLTSLEFRFEEEVTPPPDKMNEMLMFLQLPPNLRGLEVCDYKGDAMPSRWLDGLSKLVSIRIEGCEKCKVVPQVSQLPSLKEFRLIDLDELEYVDVEDNLRVGGAAHNYFPSLEVLCLKNLPCLKGWTRASKDDSEWQPKPLPCLLDMKVDDCPELMSMPVALKLESLCVGGVKWKTFESNLMPHDEEAVLWSSYTPSSSTRYTALKKLSVMGLTLERLLISSRLCNLNELKIKYCQKLRNLKFESPNSIQKLVIIRCRRLRNIEGFKHLSVLEKLEINDCEELEMEEEEEAEEKDEITSIWQWQRLSSLCYLNLSFLKWEKLPSGITSITTLQKLLILRLKNLTELPQEICKLPVLGVLQIEECPKLKSIPSSLLGLKSLKTLYIYNCPDLSERYKRPDGEDCHLIQHIPGVYIERCPSTQ